MSRTKEWYMRMQEQYNIDQDAIRDAEYAEYLMLINEGQRPYIANKDESK